MYVDVAPAIPLPPQKDVFTYRAPEKLPIGTIVEIPIGRRRTQGVVVRQFKKAPPYRTKEILRAHPISLTDEQLALGGVIAGMNVGGLGFTLRLFYPPSMKVEETVVGRSRARTSKPNTETLIQPTKKRLETLHALCQRALDTKSQVLILVPERWMVHRFPWAESFHAGLPASHTKKVWQDIRSGKPTAIVGTQKALFLPWRNLTTIIVDEEQLPAHKLWDGYPRGDNRRLAQLAQEIHKSNVIYSGSFPSLHTHYLAKQARKTSSQRVSPPAFEILPFSFADRQHSRLLPEDMVSKLRLLRQQKKKILILHNEKDGTVTKALRGLRLLKKDQVVVGTAALFTKIEDETFDAVFWMFPEHAATFPDIRSAERSYILLARLHRYLKSRQTEVLLVSRQAQFIADTFSGDSIADVYNRLLAERKKYGYPPFADMVKLTFKNKTEVAARDRAVLARQHILKALVKERDTIRVLGPYKSLGGNKGKKEKEMHLLVVGPLSSLTQAYKPVLPDIADVDPERIL